jgi:hypothetical protein
MKLADLGSHQLCHGYIIVINIAPMKSVSLEEVQVKL